MQEQFYRDVRKHLDYTVTSIKPLAGDGSDRSYYRIHTATPRTFVLMALGVEDARKLAAGCYEWTDIATVFDRTRITYPRIIATLPDALIIEDCGDHTLGAVLSDDNRAQLFTRCFDIAAQFLTIPQEHGRVWVHNRFNQAAYLQEFNFFHEMFIKRALRLTLSPADNKALQRDCAALSDFLAQFSRFFVHRDFHSRNLMVEGECIAVIDFQDASCGSPLYDLISLCFDSYMPLPLSVRLELFAAGRKHIEQQLPPAAVAANDEHWAALLLQRQLKAIGSFAKLTLVACKGDYLKYVCPALATLPRPEVTSARWPFLSNTLLTILEEKSQSL